MALGFNDNPPQAPLPNSVAWTAPSWVAATTYPAGVGGVPVLGSYVQYLGIVYAIPGLVASTPGTPPPGGVWVVVTNPQPLQSGFTFGGFFPQPPATAVDIPGATEQIGEIQSVPVTTGVYLPAPGEGYAICNGAGLFQRQVGTLGTWVTLHTFAAGSAIWIDVDGVNYRFANTTAGILLFSFYRMRNKRS